MNEDMSRAKELVLARYPNAEFIGHSSRFMGRIVVREGIRLKDITGWIDDDWINKYGVSSCEEAAWLDAASRLKADAVEPKTALETLSELLTEAKAVPVINGVRIEPKEAAPTKLEQDKP
jgi:hypothetical protein